MNSRWMVPLVMSAGLMANQAVAGDAVAGAIIGSGVGAAMGKSIGGRDGAVVGGMLGAMTGVMVATDKNRWHEPDYRSENEHRSERYTGYGHSRVVYHDAPVVVYRQYPVVVAREIGPRVVVIDDDHYWGRKHRHHKWQAKSTYRNYKTTYAYRDDDD